MPQSTGEGTGTGSARQRLISAINQWKRMDERIKDWIDNPDIGNVGDIAQLRGERRDLADRIFNILESNPNLAAVASNRGFSHSNFDPRDYTGNDGPTPDAAQGDDKYPGGKDKNKDEDEPTDPEDPPPGPPPGPSPAQLKNNRLLGEEGKEFTLVRGPNGTYVAVYKYNVNGQTVRVGITLGKGEDALRKYGLKPSQARTLSKQDMKRIQKVGSADELAPHIRKGDKDVFKSLVRMLERQYPKSWAGSMLRDDEVMSKIIAQHMFGWDTATFEAQIKDTKWWRQTEPYQREFLTAMSPKQRQNQTNQVFENVVNTLEDHFGLQWQKHVAGGMKQARNWAEKIASGVWGEPGAGLAYWSERMFDRAAGIENTPAWISQQLEQEEQRGFANRPEDMFEQLRSESMHYLGQIKGQPVIDRGTLMGWATDIVTERRSEGDWQKFLRQQMKRLHPYFDENVAFTEQASPYKSMYESIMGTPTDWDNKLLRQFQATDDTGKPRQGEAMNLNEFELMLRDPDKNPGAYQEGTPLYDEGLTMLSGVLARMRGVS